jgi:hypothetical protein
METKITVPPKDIPNWCVEQFTLLCDEIKGLRHDIKQSRKERAMFAGLLIGNLAALATLIGVIVK